MFGFIKYFFHSKPKAKKGESPLNFRKKAGEKINKFQSIDADIFIKLAKKDALNVSSNLRERYDELSDFTNPDALPCIYFENSKGWQELAQILSQSDPVLAKTIYARLLRVRSYPKSKNTPVNQPADFDIVAHKLYALENKSPDFNPEGKLAVLSALVAGSPELPFWQESLERCFGLACELTNIEKEGHMETVAISVFYSENIDSLKDGFAAELFSRLNNPKFLINEPRPAWHRGYFFSRMNGFCLGDVYGGRNCSFPPNPNALLNLTLTNTLWQWVEQYIKEEESFEALEILQHAIHSSDESLSIEASEAYIKNFPIVAKKDPKKASECLYQIASYSCCLFTQGVGREEKHQNFNLYRVFDETIVILQAIDGNAAIYPFSALIGGGHRSVPERMQRKYNSEIIMADLHQKDRRNAQ